MYLRLPTSLAIIYASFTLGIFIAIQGPSLMDLIDMLHINNDLMSFTLAFASLAYSVGGLLSGFLFNYVNRQVMVGIYLFIFGAANGATPYLTNYALFSATTIFKMMCAGGIDAANNVWMLEMWPGKDAWLQALHCAFAVGCALGPLIVEPFLSAGEPRSRSNMTGESLDILAGKNSGSASLPELPAATSETRIHTPYLMSGLASFVASFFIFWLYWLVKRCEQRGLLAAAAAAKQSSGGLLMASLKQPARPSDPESGGPKQVGVNALTESAIFLGAAAPTNSLEKRPEKECSLQVATIERITSKVSDESRPGRPPYYVMFAIALSAMCLSFYCGVEITSMNYLATFAVNIDLQLPKSTAALMSSALTISFAVGRAIGIWVAAHMKPHRMFYMCCSIMALGNLFIFVFANTQETYLWYSICIFGIGCGPMYPSIVSFYDDRVAKVTNTVSGIFVLGSMFNVALNSLIIGHHIIENALILIVCNLIGSVSLLLLFGSLHMLTRLKKRQRIRKFHLKQRASASLRLSQDLSQLDVTAAAAASYRVSAATTSGQLKGITSMTKIGDDMDKRTTKMSEIEKNQPQARAS